MKARSGAHLGFSEGRSPNTCTKFQGEIVNPFLDGAPGNFSFLNKIHGFW